MSDPKSRSIKSSLAFVYFLEERVNLFDGKELFDNRAKQFEILLEEWEKLSNEDKQKYADRVNFDKRAEEDQFQQRVKKIDEQQHAQKNTKSTTQNKRKTNHATIKTLEDQNQKVQIFDDQSIDSKSIKNEEGKMDLKLQVDEENKQNETRIDQELIKNRNDSCIHEEIIQETFINEEPKQIEEFKNEISKIEEQQLQSKRNNKKKSVSIIEHHKQQVMDVPKSKRGTMSNKKEKLPFQWLKSILLEDFANKDLE